MIDLKYTDFTFAEANGHNIAHHYEARFWQPIEIFGREIEIPVVIQLSVDPTIRRGGLHSVESVSIEGYRTDGYRCDPIITFLDTLAPADIVALEQGLSERLQAHFDSQKDHETRWQEQRYACP